MNGEDGKLVFEGKSIVEPIRECYGSKFKGEIPDAIFMKIDGEIIEHPSIELPFYPLAYKGMVDAVNDLQHELLEATLRQEAVLDNIFGEAIVSSPEKEPTPEELQKQEEFNASMKKLRQFMEENNITVDDLKDEFDLRSDEDWD